ncbi:Uncharacterized protein C0J52_02422 [Blattella germanica]|nr:Uncharacterized protein C0J52_02422 [Blattella germanica]
MKRRILNMDPDEYTKLKCDGTGCLVERNLVPDGIHLVNPFAVAKHESTDLVELAKEIQMADTMVRATACSKLQTIAEQIHYLQQQAQRVLLEAKQSTDLNHAACNFQKRPGQIYHLYERSSGQRYFSMLSPEDWGGSQPHLYIGAYRLEQDYSWTPAGSLTDRSNQMALVDKLLGGKRELTDFAMHSE